MTNNTVRSAAIFEALAALHLPWIASTGRQGSEQTQRVLTGLEHMSAEEWSAFLHEKAVVPASPQQINADVVERMLEAYRRELPLLPGAVDVVRRIAAQFPLALASSSNSSTRRWRCGTRSTGCARPAAR